jgi:hypothetical protein
MERRPIARSAGVSLSVIEVAAAPGARQNH